MTHFLSRILEDSQSGSLNEETELLFSYHQVTKHTYDSVRSSAHYLDWKNQPNPFRVYEGSSLIALARDPGFPNAGTFSTMAGLAANAPVVSGSDGKQEDSMDLLWISRLLWHSMAVSAWKKFPGGNGRYSLRVNPSSGNLHPTETYLALHGFPDVKDGLYHYRADQHALELRSPGGWVHKLSDALRKPQASESQLIIGLTSIFWREAWKYRDRAYRYCCHDMGHATMSLLLAARALGLRGAAIGHFSDVRMTRTLGLADSDEAPMTFLVFPSATSSARSTTLLDEQFTGSANELSAEEIPYKLLMGMHRATILGDDGVLPSFPVAHSASEFSSSSNLCDQPAKDSPLGEVTRRRRSALDFDPRTPHMERRDLDQLLDFATRDWIADWRGNDPDSSGTHKAGTDFVNLYLYVHRVRGYDAGIYRWERSSRSLTLLHAGNVERVAAFLSLEQTLAGNSCFTISMIADLAMAARIFGNRAYRYVYFEAGAIGQKLYLGAEALHWNATGIGAFYDDDVHRYLGFLEEGDRPVRASVQAAENATLITLNSAASRNMAANGDDSLDSVPITDMEAAKAARQDSETLPQQVIYHFAIGRAIPDPRVEDTVPSKI